MLGSGLSTLIVEHQEDDTVDVCVRPGPSGGCFEFARIPEKKRIEGQCTYYICNPEDPTDSIAALIATRFWGQFTLGSMIAKQEKYKDLVDQEIQKLAQEFEQKAADHLNKKFNKKPRRRKK